jgi:hypothetical protein
VAWYRSGVIENALAEVFRVRTDQMGVFRGRLRHLRNINCPKLPKTGSGQPVFITREQAIEILIALELTALGVAPRHAVEAAKFYAEEISDSNRDPVGRGDRLIVSPHQEFGSSRDPTLAMLQLGETDPESRAMVVGGIVSSLQQATPSLINGLLAGGQIRRFAGPGYWSCLGRSPGFNWGMRDLPTDLRQR